MKSRRGKLENGHILSYLAIAALIAIVVIILIVLIFFEGDPEQFKQFLGIASLIGV